jgi:hypothetical protein
MNTVADDPRINATHISVYMALLYYWSTANHCSPLLISRSEVMEKAKINSRHTYNQCMNRLHECGYIKYIPSSNPAEKSIVYLKEL